MSNTIPTVIPFVGQPPMHDAGFSGADVVASLIAVVIGSVIFWVIITKLKHA